MSENLEAKRVSMLADLHKLERVLSVASLSEVMRLLESGWSSRGADGSKPGGRR